MGLNDVVGVLLTDIKVKYLPGRMWPCVQMMPGAVEEPCNEGKYGLELMLLKASNSSLFNIFCVVINIGCW